MAATSNDQWIAMAATGNGVAVELDDAANMAAAVVAAAATAAALLAAATAAAPEVPALI
jgi:hypothetical protein